MGGRADARDADDEATYAVLLGPGERLAKLDRVLEVLADEDGATRFATLRDLDELLRPDAPAGAQTSASLLILDGDATPEEDIGFVRRFLKRPGSLILVVGRDPRAASSSRLLALPEARWIAWPPDLDQLRECARFPAGVASPGASAPATAPAVPPRAAATAPAAAEPWSASAAPPAAHEDAPRTPDESPRDASDDEIAAVEAELARGRRGAPPAREPDRPPAPRATNGTSGESVVPRAPAPRPLGADPDWHVPHAALATAPPAARTRVEAEPTPPDAPARSGRASNGAPRADELDAAPDPLDEAALVLDDAVLDGTEADSIVDQDDEREERGEREERDAPPTRSVLDNDVHAQVEVSELGLADEGDLADAASELEAGLARDALLARRERAEQDVLDEYALHADALHADALRDDALHDEERRDDDADDDRFGPAPEARSFDLGGLVEERLADAALGTSAPRFLYRTRGDLRVFAPRAALAHVLDAFLRLARRCTTSGHVIRVRAERTGEGPFSVSFDFPRGPLTGVPAEALLAPDVLERLLDEDGLVGFDAAMAVLERLDASLEVRAERSERVLTRIHFPAELAAGSRAADPFA